MFAVHAAAAETLTGKLVIGAGKAPALEISGQKPIQLDGDEIMRQILGDARLNGLEVEARGTMTSPGKFYLEPFHMTPLLVRQNGKLKRITYWCETCHIRASTPGPCVCCYEETELDLVDPDVN
jgi:hypothetical protein